jgi:NAD(P)-dependent dehydrogenase (short-subunit alcohol dehydrogenase family)
VNPAFRLDHDIAIVTGAVGRLGPSWVEALNAAGARVAALDLPDRHPTEAYERLARHVEAAGLRRYDADITSRDSLIAVRDRIVADFGPPTILVNNAGIDQPPDQAGTRYRLEDLPVEVFGRMVDVNLLGTFLATQVFGGVMAERGRGSIVNIGSLYASVSPDQRFYDHLPGQPAFLKSPAYGASKAGVVNLTRFFATAWGSRGVRVNALSPGGVLGDQDPEFRRKYCDRVPLGRMASVDDLKGPLVFLASQASAYVTGIELRVDGGFTAW